MARARAILGGSPAGPRVGAEVVPRNREARSDPTIANRFRAVGRMGTIVVVVVGLLVLLGWALDSSALKSLGPGQESIKSDTAVMLVLSGVALWLLGHERLSPRWRHLAYACAVLVLLVALAVVFEYVAGRNVGIDQLLFAERPPGGSSPGRPAPKTALGLALIGLALLLWDVRMGRAWPSHILMLVVFVVAALALMGYASGVRSLYGIGSYSRMAPATAASLAVLALSLLASRPTRGATRLAASNSAGGILIRRFLPLVITFPAAFGALQLSGQNAGLYGAAVGLWIMVMGVTVMFSTLTWSFAHEIDHLDQERDKLSDELASLAQRDPLTGLFNRRRFDEELARAFAHARRYGSEVAAAMIDLDRLKHINDTLGHAAGDDALCAAATALTQTVRATDIVARLGGDEFAVLLPQADYSSARAVAQKLVCAVRQNRVQPSGHDLKLTTSLGMAISDHDANGDPLSLLAAADLALYTVKERGGDGYEMTPEHAGVG